MFSRVCLLYAQCSVSVSSVCTMLRRGLSLVYTIFSSDFSSYAQFSVRFVFRMHKFQSGLSRICSMFSSVVLSMHYVSDVCLQYAYFSVEFVFSMHNVKSGLS